MAENQNLIAGVAGAPAALLRISESVAGFKKTQRHRKPIAGVAGAPTALLGFVISFYGEYLTVGGVPKDSYG